MNRFDAMAREPVAAGSPNPARTIRRRLLERVADADTSHLTIGAGDGQHPTIFRALPAKLPAGVYRIAASPMGVTPDQIALQFALGSYRFDRYKTVGKSAPSAQPATIVVADVRRAGAEWQSRGAALAEGVTLTRDLSTEPANVIYPESFVERCQHLAELGVRGQDFGLGQRFTRVLHDAAGDEADRGGALEAAQADGVELGGEKRVRLGVDGGGAAAGVGVGVCAGGVAAGGREGEGEGGGAGQRRQASERHGLTWPYHLCRWACRPCRRVCRP